MPINLQTAPSSAKSWSPKITASASGIAIAAVDVLFIGWRFRVASLAVPCTEPGLYRLVLCRVGDGAAIALERNGRLPDGAEEIVYLARWMLRDGETCAEAEIEVTERTLTGDAPADLADVAVAPGLLTHEPTAAERIAAANASTAAAIDRGFLFRDRRFSLSLPSQITISNAYTIRSTIPYPLRWADADDAGFVVMESAADIEAFYRAATLAVLTARSAGNAAKAAVIETEKG